MNNASGSYTILYEEERVNVMVLIAMQYEDTGMSVEDILEMFHLQYPSKTAKFIGLGGTFYSVEKTNNPYRVVR